MHYLNVCDPAAALEALPPNPPWPGNPNCGAASAAAITANNTMKNFILNFTVCSGKYSNSKKFKIKLNENSILVGFLYDSARQMPLDEQENTTRNTSKMKQKITIVEDACMRVDKVECKP